jgi:AcrR family transcriptional regulator
VSDLSDRRARKKAATRAEIRRAAQELFAARGFEAVTIADIAAVADVAVQTVFNHFHSKEDLFFDGRTLWMEGPAEAVRGRGPGTPPLRALRNYTVELMHRSIELRASGQAPEHIATLEASPALRTYELGIQHRTGRLLGAALAEAWLSDPAGGPGANRTELHLRMVASLTAALWVSAARSLLLELRRAFAEGDGHRRGDGDGGPAIIEAVESLGERIFERLETGLSTLLEPDASDPGDSRPVRRVG